MAATIRNIRITGNTHVPGHGVLTPGMEIQVSNELARRVADDVNIRIMSITPDEPQAEFQAKGTPTLAPTKSKGKGGK